GSRHRPPARTQYAQQREQEPAIGIAEVRRHPPRVRSQIADPRGATWVFRSRLANTHLPVNAYHRMALLRNHARLACLQEASSGLAALLVAVYRIPSLAKPARALVRRPRAIGQPVHYLGLPGSHDPISRACNKTLFARSFSPT